MARETGMPTDIGEVFTDADGEQLASLLFKRCGRDLGLATAAWNRLTGLELKTEGFAAMLDVERELEALTEIYHRALYANRKLVPPLKWRMQQLEEFVLPLVVEGGAKVKKEKRDA